MKLSKISDFRRVPSDEEIDRDVAELRRLLADLPDAAEPHPAYWQNFLFRVRSRLDERRTRRRWAPSMAWATVTAAAVVVVLAVTGVLPTADHPVNGSVDAVAERPVTTAAHDAAVAADPLLFEEHSVQSIVLSSEDVSMLKAIMADDEAAMLRAMVESSENL